MADTPRPPQDGSIDRRSFVARMGVITAAAMAGVPLEAGAIPRVESRGEESRDPAPPEPGSGHYALGDRPVHPADFTIWQARQALGRGELGALELLDACLERLDARDPVYRAFNAVPRGQAREAARSLDDMGRPVSRSLGSLAGIPLVLKDNLWTAGVLTTANSSIFQGFVPHDDATAWARLRREGAILLGKTQMGPLATTRAMTPEGEVTTVNAWAPDDPRVSPGGSSSGTATAVAGGIAPGGLGTQTGGSVTVPSLAQGLTGLKPTLGRVSLRGVIPLTYSRDHVGPLARDARDAALLLQVMAGPDPADPRTGGLPPVPDYRTAVEPVEGGRGPAPRWPTRLGVPPGWLEAEGDRGQFRREFLNEMEAAGVRLVDVRPSEAWRELSSGMFNAVRLPERTEPFLEHLREDVRLFGVSLGSWIQGLFLSGDEYLKGQRARLKLLRLTLEEVFRDCDVVLQPSHLPFDMIGLPLLAMPIGLREVNGRTRPDGILLGGPPLGEERLLALAGTWQARTRHHLARPDAPDAALVEAALQGRTPRLHHDVTWVTEHAQ